MQGVILVDCTGATLKWAQSLPLPLSALSMAKFGPYGVHKDTRGMMEIAMQSLAERGCKSAGLITVHPMSSTYEPYYNDLIEMAARFGLRLKNSWIRIPDTGIVGFELARFGYQAFHELWSQPERPDGLLIEPDIVAEGAVSAILELGVQIPSQLQLVLHRNENHEYICPFPTAHLLTSEKACAEALVTQIERQVSGQEVTPIYIPSHISHHPGEVGKTLPSSTFPFLLGHS
jgi:DNA-binding LacI/PurR family transcriptional regulator